MLPSGGAPRGELSRLIHLAVPVVCAELAWMAMNIVDVMMVGRLSVASIGAVSLGSTVHFAVMITGIGLLLSLDTYVSQAFGAGRVRECQKALMQGIYLALLLTPLVMGLVWGVKATMGRWGVEPEVLELSGPYLDALNWSTGPLLVYQAFRRYLQGIGLVRPLMLVVIAANGINAFVNWLLIFGMWGAPRLGVVGSGIATTAARVMMLAMAGGVAAWHHRREVGPWSAIPREVDWKLMRGIVLLGAPAAGHLFLEMGIFSMATILASKMDQASLAAHQIVLNMASVTFMVPLGISAAGAVRVGHLIGAKDFAGARRAGWLAVALGVGFMVLAGLAFMAVPGPLIRAYTDDAAVIRLATSLIVLAAIFQIFDGAQVASTGVMRGAGETHLPLYCNLVAYYAIGLPIAYFLGRWADWGVLGLWIGLAVGLVVAGTALVIGWWRISSRLGEQQVPAHDQDRHVREDVAGVSRPDRPVPQVEC